MDMSELAAETFSSGANLSVEDHGPADSCSESDHNHIPECFSAALPHFAESCDIRIIFTENRNAIEKRAEIFLRISIFPAKICTDFYVSAR